MPHHVDGAGTGARASQPAAAGQRLCRHSGRLPVARGLAGENRRGDQQPDLRGDHGGPGRL